MDDEQQLLEGIAGDIADRTGCDPPIDAFDLAARCGFTIESAEGRVASLPARKVLHVPTAVRTVRQHGLIAHELGHWALQRARHPDPHRRVGYLAGALMLPRRPFERDMGQTSWNLEELRARHLNVSVEMIARRIVSLRDAVCSVWDEGRLSKRVVSPWLVEAEVTRAQRPTKLERAIADEALETGKTVQAAGLIWAVPVFSPGYRRVIVIAEAEQLSLRF